MTLVDSETVNSRASNSQRTRLWLFGLLLGGGVIAGFLIAIVALGGQAPLDVTLDEQISNFGDSATQSHSVTLSTNQPAENAPTQSGEPEDQKPVLSPSTSTMADRHNGPYEENHPDVTVTVRFRDLKGAPVAGLEFAYDRVSTLSARSRIHSLGHAPSLAADAPPRKYTGVADEDGVAEIVTPVPAEIALAVTSATWTFNAITSTDSIDSVASMLARRTGLPNETLLLVKQGGLKRSYEITVTRAVSPQLFIEYADGTLFTGTAHLSFFRTADRSSGPDSTGRLSVENGKSPILCPVPVESVLGIAIEHDRMGFQSPWTVEYHAEDLSPSGRLIIPETTLPQISFRLELPLASGADPTAVYIRDNKINAMVFSDVDVKGTQVRTGPINTLFRGPFTLLAIRGNLIWRATDVDVAAGEEITFTVQFQLGGRATVRVLKDDGNPPPKVVISGSALSPNWHLVRPSSGDEEDSESTAPVGEPVPLKSGLLHPGPTTLYVLSPGYEPYPLEFTVIGGETTDLGQITLTPSRSTVIVQVSGMKAGRKYNAYLIQPAGESVTGPGVRVPDDGILKFNGIATGEYFASVTVMPSGKAKSERFTISSNGGDWVVDVDVTELE